VTVKELAEALKKTSAEVIKKLMGYGVLATLNQEIDFDTAAVVAEEFGVKAEKEIVQSEEDILFDDEPDDPEKMVPRPPVVVVMGHVDHGKTSLLDAIRSTHVIDSEAGGITQHIGAYTVRINDRNITFLDTPGHEAFTAMRARGAQVTDVAILVVAADDGVMPQTEEAINHARSANVSIIVAINKIDKPGANPEKVRQELMQHGLVPEEWGGDVICVEISAKKLQNIDQLLEMVLLTADMLELKADPTRQAKGTVIEAKLDKNRGPVATLLVQRGTLNVGDPIITGTVVGRIRAMTDDKGKAIKSAGPSTPVEIIGLPDVPEAGETFYVITDEKLARQLAEKRKLKQQQEHLQTTVKISLDDLYRQIQEGKVKDLNIIIKADVMGTVEALRQSLEKLSNDEVRVNVIHGGVGAITESDVTFADVSNAIIIGFNVRPMPIVVEAAKSAGVDIRLYNVIYNVIDDMEAAMKGMLEPTYREVLQGRIEVRQIFRISGIGTIAGCYVLDGKITRNSDVRVVRDGIVIHEGSLASLKRFKDDVKEVLQGFECGLSIDRFNDIRENDIIEAYVMEEVKR
jgi:translation initiation factor IF-2